MYFPVADIHVFPLFPALAAFVIAFFCSTAGVTGAVLLLPFQMSVLGFTSPAVTATNHLYNVFAGPGALIRFIREKRLFLPLTFILIAGTLPGIIIGIYIRIFLLPDPLKFKLFVACVLLVIGAQLMIKTWFKKKENSLTTPNLENLKPKVVKLTWKRLEFRFNEQFYTVPVSLLFLFTFIVGLTSGAYGIGGGSLSSAFLIGILGLPVYLTAGATICTTFFASLLGTIGYSIFAMKFPQMDMAVKPDWLLAFFLGIGGISGSYLGAMVQKYIPAAFIHTFLAIVLLLIALKYGIQSIPNLI